MITDVEDYFVKGCGRCPRFDTADCSTVRWADGVAALRVICREAGLEEAVRWGHPCYRHAGRNIAIIGAFQNDFRLSFFEAGLMQDPEGVLEKQGRNTQHADMIRFMSNDGPVTLADTIRAYLAEAKAYADEGKRAPKLAGVPDLPEELIEALDADPKMAEAFHALTPGRQRSYVIDLRRAKQPATRRRRIDKARPRILDGKGANER